MSRAGDHPDRAAAVQSSAVNGLLAHQMPAVGPDVQAQLDVFLAGYVHTLDDGRFDTWPAFFAEDAVYQVTTRENFAAGRPIGILYCEGRGMMQDRVDALRTANIFEHHSYCHIVGRAQAWREADGTVGARSNFTVYRTMEDGQSELFALGRYLDRIAVSSAGLRFKERRVILDSRRIDVLLVLPL